MFCLGHRREVLVVSFLFFLSVSCPLLTGRADACVASHHTLFSLGGDELDRADDAETISVFRRYHFR